MFDTCSGIKTFYCPHIPNYHSKEDYHNLPRQDQQRLTGMDKCHSWKQGFLSSSLTSGQRISWSVIDSVQKLIFVSLVQVEPTNTIAQ